MKDMLFHLKNCPRCRSANTSSDLICDKCKSELMLLYKHEISWKVALEIEMEEKLLKEIKESQ